MKIQIIILASLLLLIACRHSPKSTITDEQASEYIVSHSGNFIKQSDKIYISLKNLSLSEESINESVDANSITITPKVKGHFNWISGNRIEFNPEHSIHYDQKYKISIDINALYNLSNSDKLIYVFDVKTDQLYFSVEPDGLVVENNNQLFQYYRLNTNVTLDRKKLNDIVSVSQDGKTVREVILVSNNDKECIIKAGPIFRKDNDSNVDLSWNIHDANAKVSNKYVRVIPPLNDFSILNLSLENNDNRHVKIVFSEAVAKQKFDGLIRIDDYSGSYKYKAVGNVLHVYLDQSIYGQHNVHVYEGLKNINDQELEESLVRELLFANSLPELKTSVTGTIVPHTDQVIFPFEAISIDTVEVQIFQIFKNNISHALRNRKIRSASTNGYLGRVIHKEVIPLRSISTESNKNAWVRYALDIKKLTDIQIGAIYQVRIGFNKSYANYECDIVSHQSDDRNSVFDFRNYYRNYNYNNRNNPCFNEYYERNKFIYNNILASNLGLIVKKGKDNAMQLVATDLRDARPKSNVQLSIYDKQNQLIHEQKTSGEGIANCQTDRVPDFIIAQSGDDYAYLSLTDNNANALSEFSVSGVDIKEGIQGFLYGERGVWRPGDTMHLSFMLVDHNKKLQDSHPVSISIKDSKGGKKYSEISASDTKGIYVFQVPTASGDPTGSWKAEIEIGNYKYTKRLKVETIKPNRLKVDLQFDNDEIDVSSAEKFVVESNWLHGAPASQLKAQVDVKYSARKTKFRPFEKYDFSDPSRKISSDMNNIFSKNLNSDGTAEVELDFGSEFRPPFLLTAKFRTRVYEKSGNFSEDYTSVNVNPYDVYTGVYIPDARWGRSKYLNVEEDESIQLVAVDKEGKPAANRKLSVGLYEARWNWWYNSSDNNIFRYNSSTHTGSIEKLEFVTDDNGVVSFVPSLNGHGRYLVRVCDTESGHCSGTLFRTSRYDYGEKEKGNISKLDFNTDKQSYKIGESMELSIPSNNEAKVFVSIENNKKVINSFWIDGNEDITKVNIPVTEDMIPIAYLHLSLLQGTDKNNDLPIRLYGVQSVEVIDPATELDPVITIAEVIRPNKPSTVTVAEMNGKPMAYTLALVDEGLLDITNFSTPDPWSEFLAKQSLSVKTWDIFDDVLNRHGGEIESVISIGGDGNNLEASDNAQANRFKPVVRYLGVYELGPGESISHTVDIPNYVGSLRAMVVAKGDYSFGSSNKNVTVKDPLMLATTLPRVLAPNESLSLPVNVFAYEDDIKKAGVSVDVSSNLQVVGNNSSELIFDSPGNKLHNFDMRVMGTTGIAEVKVQSSAANHKAYENLEIEIRNPSPVESQVFTKMINKGDSHTFNFSDKGIEGSNEAYVELSHFPDFNLSGRLDYLMRYPYGCVEQTTSSVFPQVYLDKIMNLNESEKSKIKRNITAGIKRLYSFQRNNGGLSYWPSTGQANDWGTSYAGHFILTAKEKGYFISRDFISKWKSYQISQSRNYRHSKYRYSGLSQAYRLYTLALAGEPQLSAMNSLRTQKNLDKTTKFLLSAAYALINHNEIAADIIKDLDYSVDRTRYSGYTYGSPIRDKSILLLSLSEQEDSENAYKVAIDLAKNLSSQKWYSTQSTAFALLSLADFISLSGNDQLDYTINDHNTLNVIQKSEQPMDIYKIDLTNRNNHKLTVSNNSESPMYVRMVNSGKPLPDPQPSYSRGLSLNVSYMDADNKSIEPKDIKLGTDFKAIITVKNITELGLDYKDLALNHTMPSGWEIQNLRVGNIKTGDNSKFDFQDIRDERVYTFFDLKAGETKKFTVPLTAAYAGRFFMPNIQCGAMYDEEIDVSVQGDWVEVIR